jgi:hypothetical protein
MNRRFGDETTGVWNNALLLELNLCILIKQNGILYYSQNNI